MADDNAAVNYAMLAGNMYGPNPYTKYQGRLPSMTTRGPATDAMGKTIGSYADAQTAHDAWNAANPAPTSTPGTTLNTSGTYGLQPSDLAGPSALNPTGNQAFGMANWGGMMSPQAQQLYANQQFAPVGSARGTTYANSGQAGGGTTGASQSAAALTNPVDMTQAYMDALANPGDIKTPGANVPATKPVSQQPSVLDQFLAGQKGGTGAGGYSNQGFFDTLNRLRPQAGAIQ